MRKVSIVIPVYKTEKYLARSIQSAIDQTYENLEIILVDDGSPDNCPRICDEFSKKYDFITVIHQNNKGLSSARNAGIEVATGEYILFLDSDDCLLESALDDLVKVAEYGNFDAVFPDRYYQVSEYNNKIIEKHHFTEGMYYRDPKLFAINVVIAKGRARRAVALLYRLRLIKEKDIKFPLGYISEDFFFNIDFLRYASKIGFYNSPTLLYLKRANSISTSFFPDFFIIILAMDDKVQDFFLSLDSIKYGNDITGKREALLCRNVIIQIMGLISNDNKVSIRKKIEQAKEILENERVKQAFRINTEAPYFDGVAERAYMLCCIWLIRKKLYSFFFLLAHIANYLYRKKYEV